MINIAIGSHRRFERCEPVITHSIKKHTSQPVNIGTLRPDCFGMPDTGCTGFTNMRWLLPSIMEFTGFVIYLDVDMLVVYDIAELWDYREAGKFVCLRDGATEVMIMDCSALQIRPEVVRTASKTMLDAIAGSVKSKRIPHEWNYEDKYSPNAKLIHFTDLKRQPWFYDGHPDKTACQLWFEYEREAQTKGHQ